jgi:hypothetical protein
MKTQSCRSSQNSVSITSVRPTVAIVQVAPDDLSNPQMGTTTAGTTQLAARRLYCSLAPYFAIIVGLSFASLLPARTPQPAEPTTARWRAAGFGGKGKHVIGLNDDYRILTWSIDSGKLLTSSYPDDCKLVLVSRDANKLLCCWRGRETLVFDSEDMRQSRRFDFLFDQQASVSTDGRLLATATRLDFRGDDCSVFLTDLTAGQHVELIRFLGKTASCTSFDNDGKNLAIGFNDGSVAVVDLTSHKTLATLAPRRKANVTAMGFSRDGCILCVGGEDERVTGWDWKARRVAHQMDTHTGTITSILCSSNGMHWYSLSTGAGPIRWTLDGKVTKTYEASYKGGLSLHVSPDAAFLLVCSPSMLWTLDEKSGAIGRQWPSKTEK